MRLGKPTATAAPGVVAFMNLRLTDATRRIHPPRALLRAIQRRGGHSVGARKPTCGDNRNSGVVLRRNNR
jgi:hypothetical protein